jgi:Mrp family chromosome partitioning ATPase
LLVICHGEHMSAVALWSLLGKPVGPDMLDHCRQALAAIDGSTLRSIAVVSAVAGEGRSTIASAIALIEAEDYGRRTLLMRLYSPEANDGEDGTLLGGSVGYAVGTRLSVLDAAGLTVKQQTEQVQNVLGQYEFVVADFPALLLAPATRLLLSWFEQTLMVVRAGTTPVKLVRAAARGLEPPPAVILNHVSSSAL